MFFGSDNQTGCSARVLQALTRANEGFTPGYGDDEWTAHAADALQKTFETELDVFFVASGTAANCLSLAALVAPWQTILAHSGSHILLDESTAPEFFTAGARIHGIGRGCGKLTPALLNDHMTTVGQHVPHNPLPGAVSLAQANENGLVYTPDEVAGIATWARQRSLGVHMDGARFSNAVASLACTPAEITWKAGVDILVLGASKNGCLAAEAVIVFDRKHSQSIVHQRKRSGHLLSKGRFFGAQFSAWLEDDHWLDMARHANRQARMLAEKIQSIPGVLLAWPVDANELFVCLKKSSAAQLRACGAQFHEWYADALPLGCALKDDEVSIRLVCSFATSDAHIDQLMAAIAAKQPS
jgi:threonine aldolase